MPYRPQDLNDLTHARGIRLETRGPDGEPNLSTHIWVAVDRDQVFVRSFRDAEGNWYEEARANSAVTIDDDGRRLEAIAIPVHDADSIHRASEALQHKYGAEEELARLLAPEALSLTLRLDPRHSDESPLEAPAFLGSEGGSQLGPGVDMSMLDSGEKLDETVILQPQKPV